MYKNMNISTSNKLCKSSCKLYRHFMQSHLKYLKFVTVVDIVPSVVGCKEYFFHFKNYGLIHKAKYYDYQYQYLEINKNIYSKYIIFKRIYVEKINQYIKNSINIENTIGIHYRMNDNCFNRECSINKNIENRFFINLKSMYKQNSSIILISTLNNKIAKEISNGYKYLQYMPLVKPIHLSKTKKNITNDEISKIIGDILLIASAKHLILSAGSTFSGLILSIGGIDSNGKKKKFDLYDSNGISINTSYVDIIALYNCVPSFYSII